MYKRNQRRSIQFVLLSTEVHLNIIWSAVSEFEHFTLLKEQEIVEYKEHNQNNKHGFFLPHLRQVPFDHQRISVPCRKQ